MWWKLLNQYFVLIFSANAFAQEALPEPVMAIERARIRNQNIIHLLNKRQDEIHELLRFNPLTLQDAERAYKRGQYQAAIFILNDLRKSAETILQVDILYLLAKSYDKISDHKNAIKHYTHVLESLYAEDKLVATKTDKRAEIAIKRLLYQLTRDPFVGKEEVLPKVLTYADERSGVFAASAIYSEDLGATTTSEKWIVRALNHAQTREEKAGLLYFRGILGAKRHDFKSAHLDFTSALDLASDKDLRSSLNLALGRLNAYRGKFIEANEAFDKVAQGTDYEPEAIFESILAYLQQKDFVNARKEAMLLIASYPDLDLAKEMRLDLPKLDFLAGDYDQSLKTIAADEKALADLKQKINQYYRRLSPFYPSQLIALVNDHRGVIDVPQQVKQLVKVARRMLDVQQKSQGLQGQLNGFTFAATIEFPDEQHTAWAKILKTIREDRKNLFLLGHELNASERYFFQAKTSEAFLGMLKGGEELRRIMFSEETERLYDAKKWQKMRQYILWRQKLEQLNQKLLKVRARHEHARYFTNNFADKSAHGFANSLIELAKQQKKQKDLLKMGQVLDRLARLRLQERLVTMSPLYHLRQQFVSYQNDIFAERASLLVRRGDLSELVHKTVATKYDNFYGEWQHSTQEFATFISQADQKWQNHQKSFINDLIVAHNVNHDIYGRYSHLLLAFHRNLSAVQNDILNQCVASIDNQLARLKKWRGDIAWLKFEAARDKTLQHREAVMASLSVLQKRRMKVAAGDVTPWSEKRQ